MRTTITLDPEAAGLIRQAMLDQRLSFKQAVNLAIVRGLTRGATRPPFVQATHDLGEPLVDLTKAQALAAALEDEETIRKLQDT